jgi:hypothetical protein
MVNIFFVYNFQIIVIIMILKIQYIGIKTHMVVRVSLLESMLAGKNFADKPVCSLFLYFSSRWTHNLIYPFHTSAGGPG